MSILSNFVNQLINFLDNNKKTEQVDSISNYPDTPRLNGSLRKLLPETGKRSGLIIPATEATIATESYSELSKRLEKESNPKYRSRAQNDYFTFSGERSKMIKSGFLYVSAERIQFDLVKLTACIKDGGRGDEDGFGVEPDTYVNGYLSLDGEFISPVALEESKVNMHIKYWMLLETNPLDSDGKIKNFPFDQVEKIYKLPGFFEVKHDNNVGIIDKNLNIIITLEYKMLYSVNKKHIWVRLHSGLCGIVDLKNNIVIPPVYNFLSNIEGGKYKGLFVAELSGRHGLINLENEIILPFKEIDIKDFYNQIEN